MKSKNKWMLFADQVRRIRDIDYFEVRKEKLQIVCHYHLGISFVELNEFFKDQITMLERFSFLLRELDVAHEIKI